LDLYYLMGRFLLRRVLQILAYFMPKIGFSYFLAFELRKQLIIFRLMSLCYFESVKILNIIKALF